jgi:hypothetical protein
LSNKTHNEMAHKNFIISHYLNYLKVCLDLKIFLIYIQFIIRLYFLYDKKKSFLQQFRIIAIILTISQIIIFIQFILFKIFMNKLEFHIKKVNISVIV